MYQITNARGRREDILLDDPQHPEYASVKIGQSTIAGQGLFARKDLPDGEFICQYWGELVKTAVANSDNYKSDYLFQLNDRWSIDGKDPNSCYARYINDPIRRNKYNAAFVLASEREYQSGRGIPGLIVIATRLIRADEEIFASYGNDYWASENILHLKPFDLRIMYARSQRVRKFVNANYDISNMAYIDDGEESDPELQPV